MIKNSVIGKEDNAWVMETYNLTGKEEIIVQICVAGIDNMGSEDDINKVEIK